MKPRTNMPPATGPVQAEEILRLARRADMNGRKSVAITLYYAAATLMNTDVIGARKIADAMCEPA